MLELFGENTKTGAIDILDVGDSKKEKQMIEIWMRNSISDTSEYDSFFVSKNHKTIVSFTRNSAKEKYGEQEVNEEGVILIPTP